MASIVRQLGRSTQWRPRVAPMVTCYQKRKQSDMPNSMPYRTLKDEQHANEQQTLPKEADVVVIGGGVAGCALLYYLSKMGMKKAVLLEKHVLTAGTTWHTNALIWHLRPNDVEIQLLGRTWDLVESLPKESGIDTGVVQNGGLFIASTKERLDEYKRLATIGRAFGVESRVLSPNDSKTQFPHLYTDDMYGALLSPSDGSIDAAGYCTALTRVASSHGATVVNNCPVTSIQTTQGAYGVPEVTAVHTIRGTIKTKHAVVCGGVWSAHLLQSLGVNLPVQSVYHSYIVTGTIPNLGAMPNVRDHDGCVALRVINNYVCLGGYEPNPPIAQNDEVKTSPNDDTAFRLSDLQWDSFSCLVEAGIRRMPVLQQVGIKNTVCGFEAFTPDHRPLIGPVPQARGLFVSCAFNSAGIMLSGGCAHELAHWIVRGAPELDMFAYDVRRFNPKVTGNARWLVERSHEAYATNYNIVFKNEEPLAGRNQLTDELHQTLLQHGAIYQERFGWERPAWFQRDGTKAPLLDYDYGGFYGKHKHPVYRYRDLNQQHRTYEFPEFFQMVKAESLNCRGAAALFNMSSCGKFFLTGPDASRVADWLFSHEVDHKPGAVTYSLLLNKRGGVELDAIVCTVHNEQFDRDSQLLSEQNSASTYYYVVVDTALAEIFKDTFNREIHERRFDCQLHDVTSSICTLSLQGPNSRKVLRDLSNNTALVDGDFPNLSHRVLTRDDSEAISYRAVRVSRTGEIGWDLHVPTRDAVKFYQSLLQFGGKYGLANAGHYALSALATEKGLPWPHVDVGTSDTPFEASLDYLCKLKSQSHENFLGRDALLALANRALDKRLLCFTLQKNNRMLNGLEAVYRNGKVAGYIRRADYAFVLNQPIAYGYVERKLVNHTLTDKYIREGKWQIEKMGTLYDAEVHLRSPFDTHGDRLFDGFK